MTEQELRIGNLVLTADGKEITVDSIEDRIEGYIVSCWEIEGLSGIPLTEEWLLKFGFKKYRNCWWKNQSFYINIKKNNFYVNGNRLNYVLTKVHQLQNLYFALTENELQVK